MHTILDISNAYKGGSSSGFDWFLIVATVVAGILIFIALPYLVNLGIRLARKLFKKKR